MSENIQDALVYRIERHIVSNRISDFLCSFHGGEPLLFGASRLERLVSKVDEVAARTGCRIRYAITTNGTLIDAAWIMLFKRYHFSVTCSIDGPPEIHDAMRVTLRGGATWEASVRGYLRLCRAGIMPAIIGVCHPNSSPRQVLTHYARDLGVKFCDVLMPDHNHADVVPRIDRYYIELFDDWYDNHMDEGIEVRLLAEMVRGVLGLETRTDSIGYAPLETISVNTDGSLEPHDVLRIAGVDEVSTGLSVLSADIIEVASSPLWLRIRDASLRLPEACQGCRFKSACGGGHLGQRWSPLNGYDNPSVYCSDLKAIFEHITERLSDDITIPIGQFPSAESANG